MSSNEMLRSWAMNPSTENTAKPAKILVALFRQHSAKQSLEQDRETSQKYRKIKKKQQKKTINVMMSAFKEADL